MRWIGLFLLSACSSSAETAPASVSDAQVDTATVVDTAKGDTTKSDAVMDAAACHDLALPVERFTIVNIDGTRPAPTGGTIPDGTYAVTQIEHYTGPASMLVRFRNAIRVKGDVFEQVNDATGVEARDTVKAKFSGTTLTMTDYLCSHETVFWIDTPINYSVLSPTQLAFDLMDTPHMRVIFTKM
jgi:hypothetical protein